MKDKLFSDLKSPIVAINDLIDKYANKNPMLKSEEYLNISKEIRQYVDEKLRSL